MRLARELRFGVHAAPASAISRNGLAGDPPLESMAPFVCLRVLLQGQVKPDSGMLVNIKDVDRILQEVAVPLVRSHYHSPPRNASHSPSDANLILHLRDLLSDRFPGCTLQQVTLALSPYLRMAAMSTGTTVQITERFEFSAAHRLHNPQLSEAQNREVFGKCNNPSGHGHNYELEVTVEGTPAASTGVVIPIGRLQRAVEELVLEPFDHKHLNVDCPDFAHLNPTVENIARVIFTRLTGAFGQAAQLRRVRVWETPKTWAECEG